jgi:FKBP-type peptidyl-prolyl cis-trans isomerase
MKVPFTWLLLYFEPLASYSLQITHRRQIFHQIASTGFTISSWSWASTSVAALDRPPAPDLVFSTGSSGLQYADAQLGTGQPITQLGSPVAIDYVMATTGARYGTKIYSTQNSGAPYRWKLGDGTTIQGLEEAVAGGPGVEPMRPGGIRRVIIPSSLGYESLARPQSGLQYQDCQEGLGVGPIPPKVEGAVAEYYQRFKNIYCNANRPYQPDLVMDIKLYGPRS